MENEFSFPVEYKIKMSNLFDVIVYIYHFIVELYVISCLRLR